MQQRIPLRPPGTRISRPGMPVRAINTRPRRAGLTRAFIRVSPLQSTTLGRFGCCVSQGGTWSFLLQFGVNRRLVTIGRYHPEILPLAKARAEAKRILAESILGKSRPHKVTFKDAKDQAPVLLASAI